MLYLAPLGISATICRKDDNRLREIPGVLKGARIIGTFNGPLPAVRLCSDEKLNREGIASPLNAPAELNVVKKLNANL